MLSKKIATILLWPVVVGMLAACNEQTHNGNVDAPRLFTPFDWLLLGGALILLFLVPVIIMYWPRRTLN